MTEVFKKGRFEKKTPSERQKGSWLYYALPMIVVWIFFLLIFFPGFMTDDAFYEWRQAVSGQYNDWHPILYALLIWLVSKIYFSPSSMVITQILMVSLSVAWGLAELENMRVSKKVLWILSLLFAVIPFNIIFTLNLWKDIPYSAAIFILAVIFLKIVNSKGEWLKGRWNWLGLGLILGVISLLRMNGIPVAFGSIILLLLFFRHDWRKLVFSTGILTVMLAMMFGPVYSILKVKHVPEFGTFIFLHHIAAHINAGTPLTPDEADYLSKLAPLDSWRYNCCAVNSTLIPIFPDLSFQKLDLPILKQDIKKPIIISVELFLRNPGVDFHHMVCISEVVWKIGSKCRGGVIGGLSPISKSMNPVDSYRISRNEFGFVPASIFPGLIRYANPFLQVNPSEPLHPLFYSPVIYLLMAISCTIVLIFRKKRANYILFLIPITLQTITLILVIQGPSVRFQYGVLLVGLLSLGFIFVPSMKDRYNPSKFQKTEAGKKFR
jgi:hypothetical protein